MVCRFVSELDGLGFDAWFVLGKKSVIDFCFVIVVVAVVIARADVVELWFSGLKVWVGSARLSPIL